MVPHQCHKAHANANIPHLDGFVSGARQQEGAWLTALLGLVRHRKDRKKQTLMKYQQRCKTNTACV